MTKLNYIRNFIVAKASAYVPYKENYFCLYNYEITTYLSKKEIKNKIIVCKTHCSSEITNFYRIYNPKSPIITYKYHIYD